MIKYHPSKQILMEYVAGDLPASIAIAVSIHSQMCEECNQEIQQLTQALAHNQLESETETVELFDAGSELDDMMADILMDDDIAEEPVMKQTKIKVNDTSYKLPRALSNVPLSQWRNLGKLSRSSIDLGEGHVHSHLLHIDAGGEVPCHTHKGFEITLLLDGSFEDEMGRYTKGDFILLDNHHNHQPRTKEGCLCYTVADDALHFTKGIHKLFNPIGSLIY